jgi:ATP-dependent Lon protease
VLLQFLEKSTAREYVDIALKTSVDLSHVSYIATANNLNGMADHFLSRFELIKIDAPTEAQLLDVALSYHKHIARDLGVDERFINRLDIEEAQAIVSNADNMRELVKISKNIIEDKMQRMSFNA